MISKNHLSVIIPVSKDIRIKDCLQSIHDSVEIIIVLNNNPSYDICNIVSRDTRCRLVRLEEPGCNLAKVFNVGIRSASNENVLLLNSDCIIPPTMINEVASSLKKYKVVKARVTFLYNSFPTKLVAKTRWLHHHIFDNGRNLFGPGLAFNKSISLKIGGYFFDERLEWGEDGDLSTRIYQTGIPVYFLNEEITHGPEGIMHDLAIAYRIGKGERAADEILNIPKYKAFIQDIGHLCLDSRGRFRIANKYAGFLVMLYYFIWKIIFHFGYYIR